MIDTREQAWLVGIAQGIYCAVAFYWYRTGKRVARQELPTDTNESDTAKAE